ncbi:hypothetical protein RRG08_008971 [Elysia crispata]|uniref:Uncharacterized protein n=1 Tax=Elysia crispata TaxID=231223 RepID=A0AAE1AHB0_9GAST|nr:hypothetical protein RRG08_008971 [Elysia crispata]
MVASTQCLENQSLNTTNISMGIELGRSPHKGEGAHIVESYVLASNVFSWAGVRIKLGRSPHKGEGAHRVESYVLAYNVLSWAGVRIKEDNEYRVVGHRYEDKNLRSLWSYCLFNLD